MTFAVSINTNRRDSVFSPNYGSVETFATSLVLKCAGNFDAAFDVLWIHYEECNGITKKDKKIRRDLNPSQEVTPVILRFG